MDPINVFDLETLARAKLPPETYDFVAGGAEDEETLRENRAAFARIQLRPRVLTDVSSVDTSTEILGQRLSMPILLAPVGGQRMLHPDGDLASARAAAAAGTIMVLSTTSSYAIEDVAGAGDGRLWFQLYMLPDRDATRRLVDRAQAAGCRGLCLTVDSPRYGHRERELRHGDSLIRQFVAPANLADTPFGAGFQHQSVTWDDIDWLRSLTDMPLVIKGIMTGEDARLAVDHGVDAIIVSNHGGRQLDGVPATIDVLPEVVATVEGHAEVLVDGGIRRGTDVLKALALGARAVLVGRAFLWGLAYDGEAGVSRVLALLSAELETAMALAGCSSVAAIDSTRVRRRIQ